MQSLIYATKAMSLVTVTDIWNFVSLVTVTGIWNFVSLVTVTDIWNFVSLGTVTDIWNSDCIFCYSLVKYGTLTVS